MSKVCFITCILGNYEKRCRPFATQTIPADFICFTDNTELESNGWELDFVPYCWQNPSPMDNGKKHNSLLNNIHRFNVYKYYKLAFQNIPRLKNYDAIIWIDGSLEITSPTIAEYVLAHLDSEIIGWKHEWREGKLVNEVNASIPDRRFASIFWNNQSSPFQDIRSEYLAYLKEGFEDVGVWVTCMLAYHNKSPQVKDFLSQWYDRLLTYANHDQVSFPMTVWKTGIIPLTLPNEEVKGEKPHLETDWYRKFNHAS